MNITRERVQAFAKQYGFAAAVMAVLALMAVIIIAKDLLTSPAGGAGGASPGAGMMAAGGGAGPGAPGARSAGGGAGPQGARPNGAPSAAGRSGMELPVVGAAVVQPRTFSDSVRALGTAQARESITITSKVQDVIRAIRFESGQIVTKGQVLVELSNVEQAADLNEARAQLVVDERAYKRYKELVDRGFVTRAQFDQAEAAYERSKANVAGLQSRMADRTIRAPFAGVVGLRTASPGQLASPGQSLGTLDDISVIKLDFDVPETQLSKMYRGAPLEARTAAFAAVKFEGRINEIDSRVNTTTRTVRVRALLPNKDRKLKPGMLMTVDVLSNRTPSLAIPELALTELGADAYVYRLAKRGPMTQVEQVFVKTGRRTDGFIEIIEGVSAGDQVIVEGVNRVRPGMPVRVKPLAGADEEAASGAAKKPVAQRTGASAAGARRASATVLEGGGAILRARN